MKKKDEKRLLFLLVLLGLLIYNFYVSYSNVEEEETTPVINNVSSDLQIYYLDVGQADSILITNEGHNMLIDAGNNEDGPKLVDYFKSLGIEKFDYVVGTHPHEDHIGGLDDVVNNFEVMNIYMPDAYTTTKTFEDVLDAIENKNLEITVPSIGDTFFLGEAQMEIIYTGKDENDLNNTSVVIRSDFGNTSYLFTGDATSVTEENIIDENIDVDVLKVGHHGSQYSSTNKFLSKVNPRYAIISVGKDNSYNHPSKKTIKNLKKYTKDIYRTDELGTIHLTSDGEDINFDFIKTDTNGG